MKLQVVIRNDQLERPVQYDLLLKRKKERYELVFATAMILVRSSDLFIDRERKHASGHLMGWPELSASGEDRRTVVTEEQDVCGQFFSMLV